MAANELTIVADVGGTNARFATVTEAGGLEHVRVLAVTDHESLLDAARAYLDEARLPIPGRAAIAVATPVTDDEVVFTNSPWSFSCRALHHALALERLVVLNDFTALALALPRLTPGEVRQVGSGRAAPGGALALLGPGTGLGVSGLVPAGEDWIPLASEGGHVTLPATSPRERAVLEVIGQRHEHVSAERVLSGDGLVTLYRALATLEGDRPASLAPSDVTARAAAGEDLRAVEALDLFCAFLGVVAGNLALTLGARGGVYLGGGILPRLGTRIDRSPFRARFEGKGRFSRYLAPVPTLVITARHPGLTGAAAALAAREIGGGIRLTRPRSVGSR